MKNLRNFISKSIICFFLCLALSIGIGTTGALALEWFVTNQRTIAWDAPTTLANGNPIPTGDAITYEVWLSREADVADEAKWISLGGTDQLQFTVTIPDEGRWYVGVQAVRQPVGETAVYKSTVNWSNEDGEYTPNPFGIKLFVPTDMPLNLR